MIPASLIVAALVACSAPTVPGLDDTGKGADDINAGGDPSADLNPTPVQTTQGATDAQAPVQPTAAPDASAADAQAQTDSSTTTTTLPNGSTCTTDSQCQGKFCLPFKDKGLRCTSACTHDSDCSSHSCNDTPQVCDI